MSTSLTILRHDHVIMAGLLADLDSQLVANNQDLKTDWWSVLQTLTGIRRYPELGHHALEDALCETLRTEHWASDLVMDSLHRSHQQLELKSAEVFRIVRQAICVGSDMKCCEVRGQLQDFSTVYRQHIKTEEDVLFPMISQLLLSKQSAGAGQRKGKSAMSTAAQTPCPA